MITIDVQNEPKHVEFSKRLEEIEFLQKLLNKTNKQPKSALRDSLVGDIKAKLADNQPVEETLQEIERPRDFRKIKLKQSEILKGVNVVLTKLDKSMRVSSDEYHPMTFQVVVDLIHALEQMESFTSNHDTES